MAGGRRLRLGLEDVVQRVDRNVPQPVLHVEREPETRRRRVHQFDLLVAFAARGVFGVVLQRDARDLTAAGRETHRNHVVLHRELLGFRLAGCRQRLAQRLHLTFAHRGRSVPVRRPGPHFAYGRRIGGRNRGPHRAGNGIHIGVIRLFLFQIFLLLLAVDVGESQKEDRHDGNAYDRFFIHQFVFPFRG